MVASARENSKNEIKRVVFFKLYKHKPQEDLCITLSDSANEQANKQGITY